MLPGWFEAALLLLAASAGKQVTDYAVMTNQNIWEQDIKPASAFHPTNPDDPTHKHKHSTHWKKDSQCSAMKAINDIAFDDDNM